MSTPTQTPAQATPAQTVRTRLAAALAAARTRPQTAGFLIVSSLGIVLGLVLGLVQVYDRPPLEFGEVRVRVGEDLVATAQVNVRNISEEVHCPDIRIAARDREGRDLELVQATPIDGDGVIPPARNENYVAEFQDLTQQDLDEQLDEFTAYAFDLPPCP